MWQQENDRQPICSVMETKFELRAVMDRRQFIASGPAAIGVGANAATAQDYSDYSKDPRPDVSEGTCTAGSLDGDVFAGPPVVSGPASNEATILQPLKRMATGHLEYAVEGGEWNRVEALHAGMRPLSEHVLKFRLPDLPPGKRIRYRIVAHTIGWVKIRQFYHGEMKAGTPKVTDTREFRALDPMAASTSFVVWNDTHENDETLAKLHQHTSVLKPDFLLWNGDQSNDVHFERDMAGQFLTPSGMAIADQWPLAYVRGNHECRGPAAWSLPDFTGSPNDEFYYGFRSGPVAALVMDTGEDKHDSSRYFGGTAAYAKFQKTQAQWLKEVVTADWFNSAPHKILFCHIPLWFRHPRYGSFDGHKLCRELWSATLVDAGVKLVISGHTHSHLWMPTADDQPIAQLVGGGPHPTGATLIHATANSEELRIRMSTLDGTTVNDIRLGA